MAFERDMQNDLCPIHHLSCNVAVSHYIYIAVPAVKADMHTQGNTGAAIHSLKAVHKCGAGSGAEK